MHSPQYTHEWGSSGLVSTANLFIPTTKRNALPERTELILLVSATVSGVTVMGGRLTKILFEPIIQCIAMTGDADPLGD